MLEHISFQFEPIIHNCSILFPPVTQTQTPVKYRCLSYGHVVFLCYFLISGVAHNHPNDTYKYLQAYRRLWDTERASILAKESCLRPLLCLRRMKQIQLPWFNSQLATYTAFPPVSRLISCHLSTVHL